MVQKVAGIFEGSGSDVKAWRIFDFELPIHFDIAILALKIDLKQ